MQNCIGTLNFTDEVRVFFDGGVFCNGSVVILDNTITYRFINSTVVDNILKEIKNSPELNLVLQMKDNVQVFNKPLPNDEMKLWGAENSQIFSTEKSSYVDVIKIMIFEGDYSFGMKKLSDEVINIITKICGKSACCSVADNGKLIQIIDYGINKYYGVEQIRKTLMYDRSVCVVFGDDYNDIEMIEGYDYSVVMGNAPEILKSKAAYVTEDNDSGGIANALDKILKSELF